MRIWAAVYDTDDVLQGYIYSLTNVSVTKVLDGAGSFSFSMPVADKPGYDLLANERRVRFYINEDDVQREIGRGTIRTIKKAAADSFSLTVAGPDSLDALTRRSVLLGRKYENQTVQDIVDDLLSLVPGGWTATIDGGYATSLQSIRLDGVNVLKALIRVAQELGLHIREGDTANSIEIGAFGTANGLWAVAPGTVTEEILTNDNLVLISSINQTTDSKDVVNWIIPIGAGEGTAAQTLKESDRSTSGGYLYDIGTTTGPDGRTLYYLQDDLSISGFAPLFPAYGQIEKIVTFKEVGPVSNSTNAKLYAANALYDAAAAWLTRNSQPLETYKLSVKKVRETLKAGDTIAVTYKGFVETEDGDVTPIDLNYEYFYQMRVTASYGTDGVDTTLEIASTDRVAMDATQIVVGAIEAIDVKNVAVQTFPFMSREESSEFIQVTTGGFGLDAEFTLQIDSLVTDVISIRIQFQTETLFTTANPTTSLAWSPQYFAVVQKASVHPYHLNLFIDGVDVTSEYGGPWGDGTTSPDVTLDITDKIVNASGGLYQKHTLIFQCETNPGNPTFNYPGYSASNSALASNGKVKLAKLILGTAQAILPA